MKNGSETFYDRLTGIDTQGVRPEEQRLKNEANFKDILEEQKIEIEEKPEDEEKEEGEQGPDESGEEE